MHASAGAHIHFSTRYSWREAAWPNLSGRLVCWAGALILPPYTRPSGLLGSRLPVVSGWCEIGLCQGAHLLPSPLIQSRYCSSESTANAAVSHHRQCFPRSTGKSPRNQLEIIIVVGYNSPTLAWRPVIEAKRLSQPALHTKFTGSASYQYFFSPNLNNVITIHNWIFSYINNYLTSMIGAVQEGGYRHPKLMVGCNKILAKVRFWSDIPPLYLKFAPVTVDIEWL